MRKLFLTAALATAALAVQAQTIAPQYEEAIQVNGKAEKKIIPDEIYVSVTLKDNEPKGQTVDGLETRMKRELATLGIDIEKALRVKSMANAPRKRRDVDTSRSYELKVGDAATLGSVFEMLGEMGVSEASVVRYTHSRIEEFRREVRIEAVKNARSIAEELVGALGQNLGGAVLIVDNGFYETSPIPIYRTRSMLAGAVYSEAAVDAGAQNLDMQEITLTYNVMVKFVLRH